LNGDDLLRAFHRPRLWLALWGLLIASVIVGSLLPAQDLPTPQFAGFDKLEHVFGYGVLSSYAAMLFARRRTQAWAAVGLLVLGIALEIAQARWTSSRSGDIGDVLADLLGVLAGLAIAPTAWARGLQRIDGWLR
jgi:VanZ family protein